jgi:hypothetical protein
MLIVLLMLTLSLAIALPTLLNNQYGYQHCHPASQYRSEKLESAWFVQLTQSKCAYSRRNDRGTPGGRPPGTAAGTMGVAGSSAAGVDSRHPQTWGNEEIDYRPWGEPEMTHRTNSSPKLRLSYRLYMH